MMNKQSARVAWAVALFTLIFAVAAATGCRGGLYRSDSRGMLNAPLPQNAKLVEVTEETEDNDRQEIYSVDAWGSALRLFFLEEMRRDNWAYGPNSNDDVLFYEKGVWRLAIILREGGGAFTLMGSS